MMEAALAHADDDDVAIMNDLRTRDGRIGQ
jgi:hypothetical protein